MTILKRTGTAQNLIRINYKVALAIFAGLFSITLFFIVSAHLRDFTGDQSKFLFFLSSQKCLLLLILIYWGMLCSLFLWPTKNLGLLVALLVPYGLALDSLFDKLFNLFDDWHQLLYPDIGDLPLYSSNSGLLLFFNQMVAILILFIGPLAGFFLVKKFYEIGWVKNGFSKRTQDIIAFCLFIISILLLRELLFFAFSYHLPFVQPHG